MPTLRIFLFGNLELYRDAPLTKPPTRKSQSLLAYLVTHRSQPHSRERLAGLWWGERPERQARQSLSNALWHIRHALREATPTPTLPLVGGGSGRGVLPHNRGRYNPVQPPQRLLAGRRRV